MKRIPKLLSAVLACVMLCALFSGVSFAADTPAAVVEQTVTSGELAYTFYRYTPANFNFRGNNTPLLYVLADKGFTVESANAALNTFGFRAIADEESCTVLFVSPSNGSEWTEADYAMMQTLAGNASDNYFYGTDYSHGISEEGKFHTGRFRHYIFAEGSAAAFAKQYLDTDGATYYMPEWYSWCDIFGAGYVYAENGFTAQLVSEGWESVRHTSVMFVNNKVAFRTPYYYWDEIGVSETVETFETKYGDVGELEYYMYTPETVDRSSKTEKYPLVFVLHGSGMHPQAIVQNTTWPVLAAKEGFLVVSVNGLYNTENDTNAVADLLDMLEERYAIDPSRVYATGFSKGARLSYDLACSYSDKIAAIGLYEPVFSHFNALTPEYTMPSYMLLGQNDFYKIFPRDTEIAAQVLSTLGTVNGFEYTYNTELGGLWGAEFDLDNSIRLADERAVLNEHFLASKEDGVVYTKLVDIYNVSHNVLPASAEIMWRFLSQFSRNADGSLTVQEDSRFEDVAKQDWYYYPVQAAAQDGLFLGTSETEFSPNAAATRAMLPMVLHRMAGSPAVTGSSQFADVAADAWYAEAVVWARENKVVNGISDTEFAPDRAITREELVTMLYRYAQQFGEVTSNPAALDAFADTASVSDYAKEATAWAAQSGLLKGLELNGQLCIDPAGTATRAQAATFLLRFQTLIATNGIQ